MAQSTAPPPLDDLLLAALSGGRLAPGLRQRIRELFIWLINEETAGDRDPAARALADRLMGLHDRTRDPESAGGGQETGAQVREASTQDTVIPAEGAPAKEGAAVPVAADEVLTVEALTDDSPPHGTAPSDAVPNNIGPNDPVLNDPVLNDLALNDPVPSAPVLGDAVLNDPVLHGPMLNNPALNNPVLDDPVLNDPVLNDPAPPVAVVDPDPEPAPEPAAAAALRSLWDGLRAQPAYGRYCHPHGELPATGDLYDVRRLWKALHLVCLKLPHEESERVISAAQLAVSALPADAVPVPWAGGVPRLAVKPGGVWQKLAPRPWADRLFIVERFAWLAANDPAVRLGLQSIATSGELVPLTEDRI
ncbi:MAG TPA: hypothetical protein VGS97_07140, partial [Actinocrinis sp.]